MGGGAAAVEEVDEVFAEVESGFVASGARTRFHCEGLGL